MASFEVSEPIQNSPFEKPSRYWYKGFDEREEVKRAAAERWVAAVNADGSYGKWAYALAKKPAEVPQLIDAAVTQAV